MSFIIRSLPCWIAVCCLLLFGGCKAGKETADGGKLRKRSTKYLLGKLDKHHLTAEWFSAKAKVALSSGDGDIKGSALIRMRKDSAIWASVRKFNIEVARVFVTPDSVYMLNRLAKNYSAQPASDIRAMLGLADTGDPLSDFRNLYDLVLGNPIFPPSPEAEARVQAPHYQIKGKQDNLNTEHWLNGKDYSLHKVKILQTQENREAACLFKDYRGLESGGVFSYLRELGMYARETGRLDATLEFTRISINEPKKIRFEIPDGYQRVD